MKFDLHNLKGKKISDLQLEDTVFGIEPNRGVVRQAILAELTNMRQGTHSTKNRALVRGGGKKPFKQKGRGGARAGTIRSPLWRGGGTVFGPESHVYKHKLPKKISLLARKSILSEKVKSNELFVVEDLNVKSPKTADFYTILKELKFEKKKITILVSANDRNLDLAVRNLRNVYLVDSRKASAYDLIDCNLLIVEKSSIDILTNLLSVN